MTTDEQITQFNRVVQERIDEIQVLETRIQDRAKALMEAHQTVLAESRAQHQMFNNEMAEVKKQVLIANKQNDLIIQTIAKSKDFIAWSRRVLIYGASAVFVLLCVSGYIVHKNRGDVNDAQEELAALEARISKTPVIYKDKGVDVVRVKTSNDDKVKWKTDGKHKGAYAEIDYAR